MASEMKRLVLTLCLVSINSFQMTIIHTIRFNGGVRALIATKAATMKSITFTNYKDDLDVNVGREEVFRFKNDHDLLCFFTSSFSNCAQDDSGKNYRSLAAMDETKKYRLSYSAGIFTPSSKYSQVLHTWEAKANIAVVNELRRLGHNNVRLVCANRNIVSGGVIVGEFDGVVETESHIFLVEAKVHAKANDAYLFEYMINQLKDPENGLFKQDDTRLSNVIGILATSIPPNLDLVDALRKCKTPTWLLAANGSKLELFDPVKHV